MAKTETKVEKIEREYIIPLREKCRVVPRYKKTPKAIKTIKEFVAKHMKIEDRDLKNVKLDSSVNEAVWSRGIKRPPHKIEVRVIKEGNIVRVELLKLSKKAESKKLRLRKRETLAEAGAKKKPIKKEESESKTPVDENKDGVEDKKEEKEKQEAVVEAGQEMEKKFAREKKHEALGEKRPSQKKKEHSKGEYKR